MILRLLAFTLIVLITSPVALADPVVVRSGAHSGLGVTFRDPAGRCVLALPEHVARQDRVFLVGVDEFSSRRVFGRALIRFRDEDDDIAFGFVEGAIEQTCGDYIFAPPGIETVLRSDPTGVVSRLLEDGSGASVPVTVIDRTADRLVLAPIPSDALAQGFSGGSVRIGGTLVGLLVSVGPNGNGFALRWDRVIARYLSLHLEPEPVAYPRIVRWSGFPLGAALEPGALLDPERSVALTDAEAFAFTVDLGALTPIASISYAPPGPVTSCVSSDHPETWIISSGDRADGPWLEIARVDGSGVSALSVMRRARYLRLASAEVGRTGCQLAGTLIVN